MLALLARGRLAVGLLLLFFLQALVLPVQHPVLIGQVVLGGLAPQQHLHDQIEGGHLTLADEVLATRLVGTHQALRRDGAGAVGEDRDLGGLRNDLEAPGDLVRVDPRAEVGGHHHQVPGVLASFHEPGRAGFGEGHFEAQVTQPALDDQSVARVIVYDEDTAHASPSRCRRGPRWGSSGRGR